MFCDLVGSTPLSERLDPEDYRAVITSFQSAVSGAVRRFEGHIAKYLGDGILAYFGYPQAHEDDAELAVRSGLAAVAAAQALPCHPDLSLDARVGIATGLVVAGDIAEGGVSETGAISGETPNLAARLQTAASPGAVVICPRTQKLVAGVFDCQALGRQPLKGFTRATEAWRVTGERQARSRFEAHHGAGLTEFVGRTDEIELLLHRWERAKQGDGQVVLVSGEPGIGKSRLTRHLRERLGGEPHTWLLYQCSPHHTNSALYPVVSQLTFACGIAADESAQCKLDKLEALIAEGCQDASAELPLFADLLSIPYEGRYPALDLTPQARKAHTLAALADQLLALAKQQPVLAVFEDLHWMDPTMQDLLDLIVDRIEAARVLAVMTFRPEYKARWVGRSHVGLLALSRLSRRDCAAMARHVAARAALPPAALEAIVAKTEGVPLFVEELTHTLLETGTAEAIPATIQASLLARLDHLGPAKQVAQVGAVIGREFDHRLLATVSPFSGGELEQALERLVGSELVFRRGEPPEASYVFKHALVQDAAYESLLKTRRKALHAKIAAALRSQFPLLETTEPELLAHHYSEAGAVEPAIEYWERAGRRALERSANIEARGHYRAALALLDDLPPEVRDKKELSLQIGLGSVLTSIEGYAASGAAYRRARELCLKLGERHRLLSVLYGMWNFHNASAQHLESKRIANELIELAKQHDNSGALLAGYSGLGVTHTFMGSWAAVKESSETCIALYDVEKHAKLRFEFAEDPCVQAYIKRSLCLWNLGFVDQAVESMDCADRLARSLRHANSTGYVLAFRPMLNYWLGDPQATAAAAQTCLSFAQETSQPVWESLARVHRGWALSRLAEHADAISEVRSGIELFRGCGCEVFVSGLQGVLADVCLLGGRYDEARSAVEEGIRRARDLGEGFREAELLRLQGLIRLGPDGKGQSEAEACFERALAVARSQRARSMELVISIDLARLWRAQGKIKQAHGLLASVYSSFTEGFGTSNFREAKALIDQF
jgi:class 3 adenylate cyclase/predicted ATPase